ncbi:hypothetical protein LCGC14_2478650, partial [marine sediment metagenome]
MEEIQRGIANGVRKINVDTDIRLAFTGAIRKVLTEDPKAFDQRKYLGPARDATAAIITAKTHKVTRAPPQRSATQPVAARDKAPINGPKKMKGSEFT